MGGEWAVLAPALALTAGNGHQLIVDGVDVGGDLLYLCPSDQLSGACTPLPAREIRFDGLRWELRGRDGQLGSILWTSSVRGALELGSLRIEVTPGWRAAFPPAVPLIGVASPTVELYGVSVGFEPGGGVRADGNLVVGRWTTADASCVDATPTWVFFPATSRGAGFGLGPDGQPFAGRISMCGSGRGAVGRYPDVPLRTPLLPP